MLKKQAWCQFMLSSFFFLITSLRALILKSETLSFFLDRKRLCTDGKLIAFSDLHGQVLGLLRQIDTAKAVGTDSHVPNVNLTNTQQEHVKRISRITTVLEASLLKLDDAILLFHDF
jgi:hypothetical protein